MIGKLLIISAILAASQARPQTTGKDKSTKEVELLPNGCPADFHIHQLLPHETDCDKFYYCNFGELVVRDCAPGTHFNADIQVCDWPENVNCANAGSGSGDENDNDQSETDENETENVDPNEVETTESPVNPTTPAPIDTTSAPEETEAEILPNGCPSDFSVHQLLPHESECDKFYQCNFGELVEKDCAPGTHFNPTLQVCDWPENAGCSAATSAPDVPESAPLVPVATSTIAPVNPTNEPETTAAPEVTEAAPETTATPESIEVVTTEAPAATISPVNPTETTTLAPINPTPEEIEAEILPNGCPSNFNVHQLLPHESECDKFYYCNFGELVERDCAPGTHFNPTLQVCDWPENAGCSAATSAPDVPESAPLLPVITSTIAPVNPTNKPETTAAPEVTEAAPETTAAPESIEVVTTEAPAATISPVNPTETTTLAPINPTAAPEEIEAEILPNGCPSDFNVHQLLPHESECDKFYYCNFGELVERDCAPGTHFNPTLQVCDWPENAGCSSATSAPDVPESAPLFPVTTSTIAPVNPTNEPETTAAPEVTEAALETTGAPEPIEVATTEAPAVTISPVNPTETTTLAPINPTAAPEDIEAEILPNGCPSDFSVHQLLPHESECDKFYYCNFGELVERDCAPGTHFNPTLQVCDWPENAGCSAASSAPDVPESAPLLPVITSTIAPVNPTNEPETTAAPEVTEAAPETTGAPESIEVATTEAPAVTISPVNPTSTTTLAPINPTAAPEIEAEILPNGCPSDFSIHQLLPHESECDKFYYCVFGELVERECAPGTHFNPTLQVCDWPENAGCSAATSAPDVPESAPLIPIITSTIAPVNPTNEPETTAAPEVTEAAPESTAAPESIEVVTTEGPAVTISPVNPTETTTLAPINPTAAPEIEAEILPNGCPSDFSIHQLLPHESECDKFYYCVFGELVERECAPGTHFNPTLQVCDWPENAKCEVGTTAAPQSTEAAIISTTTAAPQSTEAAIISTTTAAPQSTEAAIISTTTSAPQSTEAAIISTTTAAPATTESDEPDHGKCQESCNIPHWAHETDCDKFWRCDGGEAVLGICPEGLHFNENLQTCDFICNAGCVRENVQLTEEKDGLKVFVPWDEANNSLLTEFLHQQA